MLANGIRETTATTGTGTITLAAVTGFTRFSAAFAVGERAAYCIRDGDNREWGVGTVGAGNTLERTFRLGTLVAGVYSSDLAGTLPVINLTSGNAEVICDVHDLLLPELGLEYLQIPANPRRILSPLVGAQQCKSTLPHGAWGTGLSTYGMSTVTTGTATGRSISSTNLFVSAHRIGYVSSTTAGTSAGINSANYAFRGNGGGRGGFLAAIRFGVADAALVADARMFVGLNTLNTAIGNVEPSTLDNAVGVTLDSTDANLQVLTRGTAAAKVDLGASFSRANMGTNANLITLSLWCPPSSTFIGYRVTMEGQNPAEATGILTTNLPSTTAVLAAHVWRNNAATAAAVAIDFFGLTLVLPQ